MPIKSHNVSMIALLVSLATTTSVLAAVTVTATGSLTSKRNNATTVLMSDGRVLIAGGATSQNTTASIEIYDPATGQFDSGSFLTLTEPRENAVGVMLPNGLILIAGGSENLGSTSTLRTAELFDPSTRSSLPTSLLGTRRENATATLLADGRVLIIGGRDSGDGGGVGGDPGVGRLSSAEIYNPANGDFTATGSMSAPRVGANAVLLTDGRVLVVGGFLDFNAHVPTSEVYDPATGQFSQVTTVPGGGRTGATVTLLGTGRVLIAGGVSIAGYLSSALLYNPANNSYTNAAAMNVARSAANSVLMPDDKVLIIGGQTSGFSVTSTIESYNPTNNTFTNVGNLGTARASASAAILPNGSLLIAGGYIPPPNPNLGGNLLSSAEIVKPAFVSDLFSIPNGPRRGGASGILLDGRILIAGGRNGSNVLASAEVFDESGSGGLGNNFSAVGPLVTAREKASSALMPDGSFVVVGGRDGNGNPLASAERFDPVTSSFSLVSSSLLNARYAAGSALLPNGRLLIAGGRNATGPLASAEIFDVRTGMFRRTLPMATGRSESSMVLLSDGTVLVAGGQGVSGVLASAERYDPSTRSFTATSGGLNTARRGAMTALLPSGKVLIAGGRNGASAVLASAELFDPASGSFSATGSLQAARADAAIMVTPGGDVMIVGGAGSSGAALFSSEIYDPARGIFIPGPSVQIPRIGPTAAVTASGRILISGGENTSGMVSLAVVLWSSPVPLGPMALYTRPNFDPTPRSRELPGSLMLDGIGLRGSRRIPSPGSIVGSEGSSGNTTSAATNFPLLRLQRIDNQQVIYQAPDQSMSWTDFSFMTPTLARFDPQDPLNPLSRMAGPYRVYVVANGFESSAKMMTMYWIEDELFAGGFEAGE